MSKIKVVHVTFTEVSYAQMTFLARCLLWNTDQMIYRGALAQAKVEDLDKKLELMADLAVVCAQQHGLHEELLGAIASIADEDFDREMRDMTITLSEKFFLMVKSALESPYLAYDQPIDGNFWVSDHKMTKGEEKRARQMLKDLKRRLLAATSETIEFDEDEEDEEIIETAEIDLVSAYAWGLMPVEAPPGEQ